MGKGMVMEQGFSLVCPNRGKERRRIEMRMISMCFTWFPNRIGFRRTQVIPQLGLIYNVCGDFTWMMSDCEELVGVTTFGTFIAVFEIPFHNYGNEIPF